MQKDTRIGKGSWWLLLIFLCLVGGAGMARASSTPDPPEVVCVAPSIACCASVPNIPKTYARRFQKQANASASTFRRYCCLFPTSLTRHIGQWLRLWMQDVHTPTGLSGLFPLASRAPPLSL